MMMTDEKLHAYLCIAKVVLLLFIAIGIFRLGGSSVSGFAGDLYKSQLPFVAERSDRSSGFMGDGGHERPVMWNLGNLEDINAELQAASREKVSGFQGAAVKNIKDFQQLENLAGKGM